MAFWVFQNVLVTAALAAIVLLLCRVGRVGPVARHALWVLVLVKFVTPPLVVWPWAAPDPLGIARLDAMTEEHRAAPKPGAAYVRHPIADAAPLPVEPAEAQLTLENEHQDASPTAASIWPWALGIWLTGSVFLVGLEGVRLARLGRRIRDAQSVDPAIAERVATLSAQFDLKPLPVQAIDGLGSPVVWCVGRPRLLWPADLAADAPDACVDGLLVHELAHIKRRDHFVGWIEFAAAIVWWWNPVFWYVRAARREQAELACDAWVISALPDGRRAYAESLLTLSIAGARGASPAAVLGVRASTRRVLERRLVMIMKGRVPVRLSWMGFAIVALMATATLPAWATGPQTNPKTPPPIVLTQPLPVAVEKKITVEQPKDARKVVRKSDGTLVFIDPKKSVVQTQARPKPEEQVVVVKPELRRNLTVSLKRRQDLPADGEELIKSYDADREALLQELEKKIAARRAALEKSFTDLQEKYTREGKLDEAVAIRDFIKAGMPGLESGFFRFTR